MCFKYNPIVSPIAPPSQEKPIGQTLLSPAELSYLTGKPSIAPDDSLPKVSDQVLAIGVLALETQILQSTEIHGFKFGQRNWKKIFMETLGHGVELNVVLHPLKWK